MRLTAVGRVLLEAARLLTVDLRHRTVAGLPVEEALGRALVVEEARVQLAEVARVVEIQHHLEAPRQEARP